MLSHLILVTILQIDYIVLFNIKPQIVSTVCLLYWREPVVGAGDFVIPPGIVWWQDNMSDSLQFKQKDAITDIYRRLQEHAF